jgi:hypothetical protein
MGQHFPRHKIAYRFATTPAANAVCTGCGRWTSEGNTCCKNCGSVNIARADFPQGEVNAAAMCAIAAGVYEITAADCYPSLDAASKAVK